MPCALGVQGTSKPHLRAREDFWEDIMAFFAMLVLGVLLGAAVQLVLESCRSDE